MSPMLWLKIVVTSEDLDELDVAWDYAQEWGLAHHKSFWVYVPFDEEVQNDEWLMNTRAAVDLGEGRPVEYSHTWHRRRVWRLG